MCYHYETTRMFIIQLGERGKGYIGFLLALAGDGEYCSDLCICVSVHENFYTRVEEVERIVYLKKINVLC